MARAAGRKSLRDRVRERAKDKEQSRGGNTTVRPPDGMTFLEVKKGTMELDFLPYEVKSANHPMAEQGEDWYERTYFIHRNIGAENKTYVCPLKTFKKPCPICEQRAELMKNYDDNEDLVKDLKPRERQIFNVIDLADKDQKIQLLDMSYYCFGEKLEKEIREGEEEWAGFADTKGGSTVKVRFGETALGTNTFLEAERVDFKAREDYGDDIFDETADLDACLIVLSYDQLHKVFLELDAEEDGGHQEGPKEEPAPATNRRQRGRTEPAKEEPANEEPPFEEEPAPAPSRRQRPEPAKEEPAPATSRRQRPEPVKEEPEPAKEESAGGECPHGGEFGESCDTLDKCFECTVWEACRDKKDSMGTGRRRR